MTFSGSKYRKNLSFTPKSSQNITNLHSAIFAVKINIWPDYEKTRKFRYAKNFVQKYDFKAIYLVRVNS